MRKDKLEDYELFYVEIPQQVQSDLEDVIITDSGSDHDEPVAGLSSDQVLKLEEDSRRSAEPVESPRTDEDLFNN